MVLATNENCSSRLVGFCRYMSLSSSVCNGITPSILLSHIHVFFLHAITAWRASPKYYAIAAYQAQNCYTALRVRTISDSLSFDFWVFICVYLYHLHIQIYTCITWLTPVWAGLSWFCYRMPNICAVARVRCDVTLALWQQRPNTVEAPAGTHRLKPCKIYGYEKCITYLCCARWQWAHFAHKYILLNVVRLRVMLLRNVMCYMRWQYGNMVSWLWLLVSLSKPDLHPR